MPARADDNHDDNERQRTKRNLLINFLSPAIYPHVEDCESYDVALQTLKDLYIKPKNKIFARHVLATRKQQAGETIEEFLQNLKVLSKDCTLEAVSVEQYREDLIQDSFINGLSSSVIRQRLLEKDELSLQQTYELATALHRAQQQSSAYTALATSISKEPDRLSKLEESSSPQGVAVTNSKKCYFCGKAYHIQIRCSARSVECFLCKKLDTLLKSVHLKNFLPRNNA